MNIKHFWTPEEDAYLRDVFPTTIAQVIADNMGLKTFQVQQRAERLGIKKDKKWLSEYYRQKALTSDKLKATQFKKGGISHNKGKKMSAYQYERCKATMFKKGNPAHNKRPVGSERVKNSGYIMVKVAEPNVWKLKHRVLYEQVHGEIPKQNIVYFIDGNNRNFDISNLGIKTRTDHFMNKCSIHTLYPYDLAQAMKALGKLKKQIKQNE